MPELIKAIAEVRDGLTLIAFLSLAVLVAFRTKKVPELFFGLVRDKLTKQQFSTLLHRFMTLGLIAFLALVLITALSYVLDTATEPGSLTLDDLRSELAIIRDADSPDDDAKLRAESQYNLALAQIDERNFAEAINALRRSIDAIPTLTAQEMLTYLYRQQGDFANEAEAWEGAVRTARKNGDWIAMARLDRTSAPRGVLPEAEGETDLIGDATPLTAGGEGYESAREIPLGLYRCTSDGGCFGWWYSLDLRVGQQLHVKVRSPPLGGLAGIVLYGTNGETIRGAGNGPGTMRGNAGRGGSIYELEWTAAANGRYFLRLGADPGTAYRVDVR